MSPGRILKAIGKTLGHLPHLRGGGPQYYQHTEPGSSPGTLPRRDDVAAPNISVMCYSATDLLEVSITDVAELPPLLAQWPVTWINVDGNLHTATLRALQKMLNLHALALEDVANTPQRPKVEVYPDHLFIIVRLIHMDARVYSEQVSCFLKPGVVLTIQEQPGDCWDHVRVRIRRSSGRHRTNGPDYLLYSLIDSIVDHYFPVLEDLGERMEEIEQDVFANPDSGAPRRINNLKRDLLAIRRTIWPLREAILSLEREHTGFITEEVRLFMRDVYDHAVQIMDMIEMYREVAGSLMDVFLARLGHKQNEVMKVLTVIATIFIPLSFITGLYGMNFDQTSPYNMPELHYRYGYFVALAIMAVMTIGMLIYFQRKGWIEWLPSRHDEEDGE